MDIEGSVSKQWEALKFIPGLRQPDCGVPSLATVVCAVQIDLS